jgi:hypothetical protein
MDKKMKVSLKNIFTDKWQQKCIAILASIIIWVAVNNSITISVSIHNVPVRIVNIPYGKTIEGLQPSGLLDKGISLTLTGSKTELEEIEPNDFEVVIDAAGQEEEWIVYIAKKNLKSLNPDIDIRNEIRSITHEQFILKLTKLVTKKIPVTIPPPSGEPPQGYLFIDVWPQKFFHYISGPERAVNDLQKKGLDLTFNLNDITAEDLEKYKTSSNDDEILYFIPKDRKMLRIPFLSEEPVPLNDATAYNLHIVFLRKEFLPLERKLPITMFYPFKYSRALNPTTLSLKGGGSIELEHNRLVLSTPLYVRNVSRQFLDLIKDNLQIVITARPQPIGEPLTWCLQVLNAQDLEKQYIDHFLPKDTEGQDLNIEMLTKRLKERFREYMHNLLLFTPDGQELHLGIEVKSGYVTITQKTFEEE